MLSRYFEHLVRHTQAKSEINEKEYLTSTDPRILKKIVDKTTEIDACYENSRNLTGINPKDESKINFCSYNMDEALDCTKKIFKNDQDEPLLALNSFTNYFVTEYDCKEEDRGVIKDIVLLSLYEGLADTKKWPGRQTFFHGYQQALKDFTKFD